MINSFTGKYRFLSNFVPCKVFMDGVEYPSVEHAYQAAKTLNLSQRRQFRQGTPGQAKRAGKKLELRPDWEQVKFSIMEDLLRQKFHQKDFKRALLNTGDNELIEGNTWGDTIWGICNGKGENNLGKLLMKIRDELNIG